MVEQNCECPSCAAPAELAQMPEVGEIFSCACCGTRLEVMGIGPLRLDKAPAIEEDFGE